MATKTRDIAIAVGALLFFWRLSARPVAACLLREEYFQASMNNYLGVTDTYWIGQTFTPVFSHDLHLVRIFASRELIDQPGRLYVHLRAVDNPIDMLPTGPDLAVGSLPESAFVGEPGSWVTIPMSPYYPLLAGVPYALAVEAHPWVSGVYEWWGSSFGGYGGGERVESYDSGVTWTTVGTRSWDNWFEEWGVE